MARTILLADDSVTAQNMGRRILTDAGYEVITVNNGSAALKKISELKPDLVVLDVYMPGYGGLEVCQRIRETRETARIPVLLSVGKLEPFKADDVRRVGADAHIVKPFEASELLTALSKLEDKIIPQPQPYKRGRFAKAVAAAEPVADPDKKFGDAETGWKERLKFPSGEPGEPEPEIPPVASTKFQGEVGTQEFPLVEPSTAFERPIPAGLPQDITPEEIAAIAAAAAAFTDKVETPASPPEPVASEIESPVSEPTETARSESIAVEATAQEVQATTFASVPETSSALQIQEETKAEIVPAVQEAPAPAPAEPAAGESAETEEGPATSAEAEPELKPSPESEEPAVGDADVLAALASLVPSGGNGAADEHAQSAGLGAETNEDIPVTAAAAMASGELAAAGASVAGPRWIAEEVPLESDEAGLILEQEMEKAFAAFAAADAAQAVFAGASGAGLAAAEAETATAPVEAVAVETTPLEATGSESQGQEAASAALEAVSQAVEHGPDLNGTETVAAPESVSVSEPAPVSQVSSASTEERASSEIKTEAAYAAAASAEPAPASAPAAESAPITPAATSESISSAASGEDGKQYEAELNAATAAAWAHWRQIRESIADAPLTAQLAEAAASEFKDNHRDAPSAQQDSSVEPSAAAVPSDPDLISSIVDSVLAELKPKLVEEIARKLAHEPKKE